MKKMTNIIVGCGGSGAKIAAGMAELMGQDPSWRHEMDENVYFMLLDTDRGDLDAHAARLRAAAPNIHVASLLTTNGYRTVGEILDDLAPGTQTGKPETDRLALERFAERWWCEEKNASDMLSARPFTVPHVTNITTGAAQVPMVSYIASWIAMNPSTYSSNIHSMINELCQTISERKVGINFDGESPMGEFNIFFLGSLAGGTGRGALIPVAFKLKEVFYKRFGRIPHISGYLMDQSCFERNREPHNVLPQMMNSMTGWSEVSSWLSYYNEETGGKVARTNYGYSLPGLINMHDDVNNVLSSLLAEAKIADAEGKSVFGLDRARLPFDAVGVIGRQSAAGFEAQSVDQIYQMISTALYVRLSKSKVDSKISNEGRAYFSVGTSVTLVPYEEIETFFQRKASLDVVHRFLSRATDAKIGSQVNELVSLLGFANPLVDFMGHDPSLEVKNPMQAFAQRCLEPSGFFESRLADLRTALANQSPAEAERLVVDLLGEAALDDDKFLSEAARGFVESFCTHSVKNHGEKALVDEEAILEAALVHALRVLESTGSAGAVEQFCIVMANRLRDLRDSVLSRSGIEEWFAKTGSTPPSASSVLDKAKSREGFLGLTGAFFSDDEIAEIMSEAKREMAVATLRALGKALNLPAEQGKKGLGLLSRMANRLEDAAARSRFLCRCASVVKDRMNISVEGLADERKKLFASSNPADDINDGADMNIRRRIRPMFPADEELVLEAGAANAFVASVIRGVDAKSGKVYGYSEKEKTEPLDKEEWLDQLKSGFQASKYKAIFPEGTRQVMEKFRLSKVVRDLAVAWRKLLQDSWGRGDKDRYYAQAQKFRNFFGIEPRLVGDTIEISGGDEYRSVAGDDFLMLGLATASARACRPFWRTSHNAEHSPHLIVQVPISIEEGRKSRWAELIQKHSNIPSQDIEQIDVLANETAGSANEHNPYVLAVYTSTAANNLDQVTTLDAWRTNPTLLEALRLAEDPEGKCPMPFNEDIKKIWPDYRGSGFTDPSYLYQPELRRNRWRPWMPKEEQEKQNQQDDGSKFVFLSVYAALGPKWYLEAALGEEQAKAILAASALPGEPIFAEGDKKMFKLGRLPVRIRAGKASTDDADIRIQIGSNVTQSIRTLPEVLAGKREARSAKGAGTDHLLKLGKSVESEHNDFFGAFAEVQGFHPSTAKAAHLKMLQKLKDYFIEERQKSNPNQEDGDREFWQVALTALTKKIVDLGG
ncbi:hypothetical protein HQ447_11800 [bacterium]|nr:hypothetical protein [bacterium]